MTVASMTPDKRSLQMLGMALIGREEIEFAEARRSVHRSLTRDGTEAGSEDPIRTHLMPEL